MEATSPLVMEDNMGFIKAACDKWGRQGGERKTPCKTSGGIRTLGNFTNLVRTVAKNAATRNVVIAMRGGIMA